MHNPGCFLVLAEEDKRKKSCYLRTILQLANGWAVWKNSVLSYCWGLKEPCGRGNGWLHSEAALGYRHTEHNSSSLSWSAAHLSLAGWQGWKEIPSHASSTKEVQATGQKAQRMLALITITSSGCGISQPLMTQLCWCWVYFWLHTRCCITYHYCYAGREPDYMKCCFLLLLPISQRLLLVRDEILKHPCSAGSMLSSMRRVHKHLWESCPFFGQTRKHLLPIATSSSLKFSKSSTSPENDQF